VSGVVLAVAVGTVDATDRLATMADDKLQKIDDCRSLVSRPQLLGVLPTWWFWRGAENWRLVRAPAAGLALTAVIAVSLAGFSPLSAAVAALLTAVFGVGLFERYIRRRTKSFKQLEPAPVDTGF
jgi:Flp pilus assembly protein TadB